MHQRTLTFACATGLHVRPAAELVKLAKGFNSDVTLETGGQTASAKSLFRLQQLGLAKDALVTVAASGPDEESAAGAVADFLEGLTG